MRPCLRSRFSAIALGSLFLLVLAGCGLSATQRTAVGQFSRAAAAVGQATSTELVQMRETVMKMNVTRLTLAGKEQDLPDHTNLEVQFTAANVAKIVRATTALQAYGTVLAALVGDGQETELKNAADSLVASLRGFPGIKDAVKDEQLDAIGTVVRTIGGWIVEYKKKEAVKTIVKNARRAVDILCDLLVDEFDITKARLGAQFFLVAENLYTAAGSAFLNAKTMDHRGTALAAVHLAAVSRVRRDEVFARIQKAAMAMKKANGTLATALEQDEVSMTDITAFAAEVQSLVAAVKVLSK